jgi:hypothetical protein
MLPLFLRFRGTPVYGDLLVAKGLRRLLPRSKAFQYFAVFKLEAKEFSVKDAVPCWGYQLIASGPSMAKAKALGLKQVLWHR